MLHAMLPWMAAFLFHMGIVVLALFLVWTYLQTQQADHPVVPTTTLGEETGSKLQHHEDAQVSSRNRSRQTRTSRSRSGQSIRVLSTANSNTKMIGPAGGATGAPTSLDGTSTGSGAPRAEFFGPVGNARKLVYLIDASGSLIDTLPFVINELKRSINELSPKQEFTVIFFQGGSAIEAPPHGWKPATQQMKQKVSNWVTLEAGNIVPHGKTNPVKAIELAMRYDPQLVFILSDNFLGQGQYEVDRNNLFRMLDQANPQRRTKINTIQFLYPDPLNTLKMIAEKHGGTYKFVSESDLGLN